MLFKKRPVLNTPMDHFLHRDELNSDERAVLDVYLTGVSHALTGLNAVQVSNARDALFTPTDDHSLDAIDLENIIGEFLKQRTDMLSQPLGLCAVMAVMQRFGA